MSKDMTSTGLSPVERLDLIRSEVTSLNHLVMNGDITPQDTKRALSRIGLALALLADGIKEGGR